MRRREVIALIGSAVASPLASQQLSTRPIIGFLGGQSQSAMGDLVAPFTQRLAELGWIEGRNIAIELLIRSKAGPNTFVRHCCGLTDWSTAPSCVRPSKVTVASGQSISRGGSFWPAPALLR